MAYQTWEWPIIVLMIIAPVAGIAVAVWLVQRRREGRVAPQVPRSTKPGWYPDPDTGMPRWWDGTQWQGEADPKA